VTPHFPKVERFERLVRLSRCNARVMLVAVDTVVVTAFDLPRASKAETAQREAARAAFLAALAAWCGVTIARVDREARPFRTPQPRASRSPSEAPSGLSADLLTLGLRACPTTAEALTAAWRKTAKRVHPDAGGSAEKFIQAKAAYERLAKTLGL